MSYVEINNHYEKNDDNQSFALTITLIVILLIFLFSIMQNCDFSISKNINYSEHLISNDNTQINTPIINESNNNNPEYHSTGVTNEILIKGRLKECLDKLLIDSKVKQDNINQIQTTINNFYEISKLNNSNTEIKLNFNNSNNKSIKNIILEIDNSRYLEIVNNNNTYEVNKIFQNKTDNQSSEVSQFNDETIQKIAYKKNSDQVINLAELKNYKIITKNIKINENIKFLRNIQIQQLVDFQQTNRKSKPQNLKLTTLIHQEKNKNEIVFFSISNENKSIKYYGYKNKDGSINYYSKNGFSAHSTSSFSFPLKTSYQISYKFGMRDHPILLYRKMHTGVDIRAKSGTPIYSPFDGYIEFIGVKRGYGKYIILKHNNIYKSAYGHMSSFGSMLKVGSYVKKGQIIGKVGSTGMASGAHLHYKKIEKNKFVKPLKVIISKNTKLDRKSMSTFLSNVKNIENVIYKMNEINKNNLKIT